MFFLFCFLNYGDMQSPQDIPASVKFMSLHHWLQAFAKHKDTHDWQTDQIVILWFVDWQPCYFYFLQVVWGVCVRGSVQTKKQSCVPEGQHPEWGRDSAPLPVFFGGIQVSWNVYTKYSHLSLLSVIWLSMCRQLKSDWRMQRMK